MLASPTILDFVDSGDRKICDLGDVLYYIVYDGVSGNLYVKYPKSAPQFLSYGDLEDLLDFANGHYEFLTQE
jgi:hypothetical protein